jgi:uncharacterized membrane protein
LTQVIFYSLWFIAISIALVFASYLLNVFKATSETSKQHISDLFSNILITVVSACLGIIGTAIGMKSQQNKKENETE